MLAELIRVRTADGLTHFGAHYAPHSPVKPLGVVWVHGMTGSFVGEVESVVPALLAQAGYGCLVVNNRGTGFRGAATEMFADCIFDIRAVMDFAEKLGYAKIALLGHSKGGVKTVYYYVKQPDPRISALGVLSPAPNVHGITDLIEQTSPPDDWRSSIPQRIAAGEGETMLTFPNWPYFISLNTLWEHMNTQDDEVSELLPQIHLPIFAACGELELDWCTPVNRLFNHPPEGYTVRVIIGADHVYTGCETELAGQLIMWLDRII